MKQHLDTVWRQLVQRRLLPVAILLVAALAAVPFVLAEDPEPVPPPAPPAGGEVNASASAEIADPIVELTDERAPARRRRVLGARKNPFRPTGSPQAQPTPGAVPAPGATGGAGAPDPGFGSTGPGATVKPGGSEPAGGSAPGGGTTTPPVATPPAVTPPAGAAPKPKKHELYSLTVRFGDSTADRLERIDLQRLRPLPSAEDPVLVYLGVSEDQKSAVFMVDAVVEVHGDGQCKPSPANCETLHMREGDTEFLDVMTGTGEPGEPPSVGAQYQLDLVDIRRKRTASAAEAKAANERESKAGRELLRARQAAKGPLRYRYDGKRGVVEKLSRDAYEAAVARVARAARAATGGFTAER